MLLEGLTVGEQVGEGSAGAVYRAQDTRTSEPVAVKVLNNQAAASLLDLKREFRVVSDLRHPGLVRLDELIVRGTEAALTMEYVDGVHLDAYLCLAAQRDWELVRSAIRRLASAIHHLHQHDVLHADLKPSNVLCEESGRIVVLDFGFANFVQREGGARGGTPMYLSPERLLGGRSGPESDWWAVGVILVEALCDSDTWPSSFGARVRAQREGPPQLPASLPSDVRQIVQGLLEPTPEQRYGWREISQLLGSTDASPRVPFVGRESELSELDEVRNGVVRLRGPTGIGKSRLASEWLRRREGVVLRSRCHPEEHIAFNAVDALVDGLAEELPRAWPERRIGAALAVVFPVLKPFVGSESQAPSDPVECRRAAFAELSGLLGDLADRVALALWIDDAQWADADSAALLRELVTADLAQRAVLAFGVRTGSTLSNSPTWLGRPDVDIILRPLEEAAAMELVASLPRVEPHDIRAAEGSPYLLTRLALDEANGDFDTLSEQAKKALFYVSIAAPVHRVVLDTALGSPLSRADLAELEGRRLVRRTGVAEVEIWHDRLTETIRSEYSDTELTAGHASIADVLLGMPEQDANALARHLNSAKRHDEAVPWLWRAAKLSEEQLAFERAAKHYASLSELTPDDRSVRPRLAEALDRAGRAAEAAAHWEKAASEAESQQEIAHLRMLSATRHLYSGQIERGRAVMSELLRAEGIRIPRFPLAGSLLRRGALALRGHRPSPSDRGDGRKAQLLLGATKGLVMVDPVLADALAVRALAESLKREDLEVRLQAIGLEAVSLANVGGPLFRKQSQKLLALMESLEREVDTPFARGWVTLCRGTSAFFETRFADGVRYCQDALPIFREECVGCWHEINVTMAFLIATLACTGRYEKLARLLPEFRADAQARGDAYSWVALHTAETYFAAIVEDDVEGYLQQADAALDAWPAEGFTSPHYQHFYARTSCLLYLERVDEAWSLVQQTWPKLRKAGFLQLEWLGGQLRHLRARVALRRLAELEDADAARVARSEAKLLAKSKLPGLVGLGQLAMAGLERGGERERLIAEGTDNVDRAGMAGFVAAASRRDERLARLLVPLV